jgi:hypothetical protein
LSSLVLLEDYPTSTKTLLKKVYLHKLNPVYYKRVFGIALSYISHTDLKKVGKGVEQKSPGQGILNQYIVNIAYSCLARWFKNLKASERKKYVTFIMTYLRQNRSTSSENSEEDIAMVLDILAQYTYTDSLPKPVDEPPLYSVKPSNGDEEGKTNELWLVGNSLVQLESLPEYGEMWFKVTIQRPSGIIEFNSCLEMSGIYYVNDLSSPEYCTKFCGLDPRR